MKFSKFCIYSDDTIIVPILTACVKLSLLKIGKQVHSYLITSTNVSHNVHWFEEDGAIRPVNVSVRVGFVSSCNEFV